MTEKILLNFISAITLSGFSDWVEKLIALLKFPALLSGCGFAETLAWVLTFVISLGPKHIFNCFLYLNRNIIMKTHPNAVVSLKFGRRVIPEQQAVSDVTHVVASVFLELGIAFILSFGAESLSQTLMLGIALFGNCGWILLLTGKTALLSGLSVPFILFACAVLLGRRIHTLSKLVRHKRERK